MEYTKENLEKFVQAWMNSISKEELINILGGPGVINSDEVDKLASKLRKFGVNLPKFKKSKYALNIETIQNLNQLINQNKK